MSSYNSLNNRRFILVTAYCLFAPLLWAVHFGFAYGLNHFACADPPSNPVLTKSLIVLITLISVLVLIAYVPTTRAMLHKLRPFEDQKDTSEFLSSIARLLAGLALTAIIWTGSALLFLPSCQ